MQNVDPHEKDEMKKLIALINEGVVLDDGRPTKATTTIKEGTLGSDSGVDPIEDMKRIMLAFQGQGSPADRLDKRAGMDRELREALITETTERGTRIGSWEIIINEDSQGLKSYDVTNVHTGEPIATSLTLYDAARGLVTALNEGQTINSRRVREILNAEAQYDASRHDAAVFKTRMATAESATRRAVMEDRYSESLEKARSARVRLMNAVKR